MTVTGRVGGGGLGPSNAAAAPRALLIIAVAVILGLVLLWKGLDTTPGVAVSPETDLGKSANPTEPSAAQTIRMPSKKPKSPTRLVRKAFLAASAALGFSNQKPISR